jgi:hypothetical protein
MIISHLVIGCAKYVALRCNGHVARVWNKQVVNTITMQYDNVSFHVKVVDTVPQFFTIAKNIMYGIDTLPTSQRTQMWAQVGNNRRRKSRGMLPSSQHFEG